MSQTKRRIFWFGVGFLAALGAIHVLPQNKPIESGKIAQVTEKAPTAWQIAQEEYPHRDPREILHYIRELNPDLDFGQLRIGEAIILPKGD